MKRKTLSVVLGLYLKVKLAPDLNMEKLFMNHMIAAVPTVENPVT
jgi:hypothetical protein